MRWLLTMLASLVLAGFVIVAAVSYVLWPTDGIDISLKGDAERGNMLAHLGGCIACHTNIKGGGALLAGGRPLETAFGAFIPPNITPDFNHGIGDWRLADFSKALRLGRSPEGHFYYPVFPYDFYTKLTDQDIVDLFEWLRTVKPVAKASVPHALPFPFNIRQSLLVWQWLYLDAVRFAPDPGKSTLWNHGAYLVEAAGHCGACHTPRDLLGGSERTKALAGAKGLPGGEASPPITAASLDKSGFDPDNLAFALEIGMLPDGDFFGGSMTKVVDLGTSKIHAEDRAAIAAYLLDQD